jgi:hypothetical protein
MKLRSILFGVCFSAAVITANAQATFPVVFHVLYENAAQNIHDSILQHQLDVLNEDFNALNADLVNVPAVWQPLIGNMQITFQLATVDPLGNPTTGIERLQVVQNSQFNYCDSAQGGLSPWPDTAYLNIWILDLNGLLGYADFPNAPSPCRGLVLAYHVVGRDDPNQNAPYNKGRVATHEMGHFLGLHHIWGDDGTSCTGTDFIADTPNQSDETYGNPGVGTVITDPCSPTAPGIMWMNFMDFSDDAATVFFTLGQVVHVQGVINTYYSSFRTVGINEPDVAAETYAVFPSPNATGIFTVNRTDMNTRTSVEAYDLQGRLLTAPEYFDNGASTLQLDLSALPNGTYSVVIRTETATETRRVVIAR